MGVMTLPGTLESSTGVPATPPTKSWCFDYLLAATRRRGFPERHVRAHAAKLRQDEPRFVEALAQLSAAPPGAIVALIGPRGTGKTQLAVASAIPQFQADAWNDDKFPLYVKLADVFREIRDTYRDNSIDSEIRVFARYRTPPLLVIDEAHERAETEFENRTLTQIIDARYDALRQTIIIANLTRAEMAKSMGPSIVSRLHECGLVIDCDWPSFRGKK
jgi:DNA replication protein DnaC